MVVPIGVKIALYYFAVTLILPSHTSGRWGEPFSVKLSKEAAKAIYQIIQKLPVKSCSASSHTAYGRQFG